MLNELTDIEVLEKTINAYVEYIDCCDGLPEQERSDLLMVARELHIEAGYRGLNVGKLF
jgi:hypothetical protein